MVKRINNKNFSPPSYASITFRLAAKPLKHSISINNRSQNVTFRLARIPPIFHPPLMQKRHFFTPLLCKRFFKTFAIQGLECNYKKSVSITVSNSVIAKPKF